jgi:hypothetical protein
VLPVVAAVTRAEEEPRIGRDSGLAGQADEHGPVVSRVDGDRLDGAVAKAHPLVAGLHPQAAVVARPVHAAVLRTDPDDVGIVGRIDDLVRLAFVDDEDEVAAHVARDRRDGDQRGERPLQLLRGHAAQVGDVVRRSRRRVERHAHPVDRVADRQDQRARDRRREVEAVEVPDVLVQMAVAERVHAGLDPAERPTLREVEAARSRPAHLDAGGGEAGQTDGL